MNTPSDSALAAYQSALLEILHAGGDPDRMVAAVAAAAERNSVQLEALDAALVAVAGHLTRTWGRLDE